MSPFSPFACNVCTAGCSWCRPGPFMRATQAVTLYVVEETKRLFRKISEPRSERADESLRIAAQLEPRVPNVCQLTHRRRQRLVLKQPPGRFAFYQGAF